MNGSQIIQYYLKEDVVKEIVDYCKNRWIAIECMPTKDGKRLFLRYWRDRLRPLAISNKDEFREILSMYKPLKPRTIYATANKYSNLSTKALLEEPKNILSTSPIWDIDGSLNQWQKILQLAQIVIDELNRHNVTESIFLKWSGRGLHIHIHENAISKDVLKENNPLDVAYSIVEYINRRIKERALKIIKESHEEERPLSIENKIDIKRVFTCPLSLHRELNLCAVCFKPDQISEFNPEWANPEKPKHNPNWRQYIAGEADKLAKLALMEVGGYNGWPATKISQEKPIEIKNIGRFQVMALLQAARYYILTGDLDKAMSFGLNRAIFYAWAKRRAKIKPPPRPKESLEKEAPIITKTHRDRTLIYIGNEGAFISPNGWFIIGNTEQTPKDYKNQIVRRIEAIIPYERAWNAAINYLKQFPKEILLNQNKFFNKVYKPVRDRFGLIIRQYA